MLYLTGSFFITGNWKSLPYTIHDYTVDLNLYSAEAQKFLVRCGVELSKEETGNFVAAYRIVSDRFSSNGVPVCRLCGGVCAVVPCLVRAMQCALASYRRLHTAGARVRRTLCCDLSR